MPRNHVAVYIMANSRRTLYIGVTNNLPRRVYEHKLQEVEGFASRYRLTKLVYYENVESMRDAITREKQLKCWTRARKIALIESMNPYWRDLARDWYARDVSLRST